MLTTVPAAFREFASRLEPTETQRSDASTKHTGVRDCLNGTLWVVRAFLTGSYDRWTIIRPPSDIDLVVVLDYSKHGADYFQAYNGAQAALDRFHARLKSCYPDTPIRKDHPAVHMTFANIGLDVIPAFAHQAGGFVIPSRFDSGWIATDPTKHADRTTAMNRASGNYFVPIVKMFKSWNRSHYSKLTGFHLEMAMADAWPRIRSTVWPYDEAPVVFSGYASAAAALFPALSARLAFHTLDPAGLGGNIDDYLDATDRQRTRDRLTAAGNEAQVALRHEARDYEYAAIEKWREIFGDPFPAYY